jgi:hypothetical protein
MRGFVQLRRGMGLRHDELTTKDANGNTIGNDRLWKVNQ